MNHHEYVFFRNNLDIPSFVLCYESLVSYEVQAIDLEPSGGLHMLYSNR